MKILGNIIWVVFGGLEMAVAYFCIGLLLMITIIGIPFGIQIMKLAGLVLWPFASLSLAFLLASSTSNWPRLLSRRLAIRWYHTNVVEE